MQLFLIKQSSGTAAQRRVYFRLVSSTDGITPITGATGAGRISKNGAADAATSGSVVEIDVADMPGMYYIELTAGEVDTLGIVVIVYDNGSSLPATALVMVIPDDPYTAAATLTEQADAFLKRDLSAVTGEASRSVLNAMRRLRNRKQVITASKTVHVMKEDDTTTAYDEVYTGTDPVVTDVNPT